MGRACSAHEGEGEYIYDFGRKAKGKRLPGRARRKGKIILKSMLEGQDGVIWTGFICLMMGTNGGLLWPR
jgi:hypothetical protein